MCPSELRVQMTLLETFFLIAFTRYKLAYKAIHNIYVAIREGYDTGSK
jgi:hypothetical protein